MKRYVKKIPIISKIIGSSGYKKFRHWLAINFSHRGHFTLTRFCRLPGQYEVLSNTIASYFLKRNKKLIHITCIACSNGAEPYSIASVLLMEKPDIKFKIDAYDIDDEMLQKAISRSYSEEEVLINKNLSKEFIDFTFDVRDKSYIVKENIIENITFHKGDALDPNIRSADNKCDILFVQNLFNNLKPRMAKRAFLNIINILNKDGFLFVDGMDLGLKVKLTKKKNLIPVELNIEKNYELAKTYVNAWPYWYSGLEPLDKDRKDWPRRYSTIFKNGSINDVVDSNC